jgi:hypothetical protein
VGPSVDLFGGLRVIEGGADNDRVYNFGTATPAVVIRLAENRRRVLIATPEQR